MISRPVQLIPTSLSSPDHHHHHHHPHITHVQTVKTDKHETTNVYPLSMHIGLSSPNNPDNSLNTKSFDNSTHPAYIHMHLLPSTSTDHSQPVQLTLPNTHLYSSPSSVLISTSHQRSTMDINNNHQGSPTITTPIIREMHLEEKNNEIKNGSIR